ncbi:DUF928 domain-containing protein [Calothrix sp. FACHB-156]|nr:DUF928 domain-containing protein [Calothrix sp. FACHB-156]
MLLNRGKGLFLLMSILVSWHSYSINLLAWAHTEVSNKQLSATKMNLASVEKDPPKRGTPPGKEGTGSRGECNYQQNKPPLTHIVGGNQSYLSVKDYPTIWVYLPYSAQEVTHAEFSLQDGDTEVYRTRLNLPSKSGIMGITLPSSIPALKVDKKYRWYVDINCTSPISPNNSLTTASITGVVQKKLISVELDRDLKTARTPLDKIFVYAKHDIWYEAITELAQLRLHEPNNSNFKKVWIDFLNTKKFSLGNIAQEPIIVNMTFNISQ